MSFTGREAQTHQSYFERALRQSLLDILMKCPLCCLVKQQVMCLRVSTDHQTVAYFSLAALTDSSRIFPFSGII